MSDETKSKKLPVPPPRFLYEDQRKPVGDATADSAPSPAKLELARLALADAEVIRKRGRPRLYRTEAEKQRAKRQRQARLAKETKP